MKSPALNRRQFLQSGILTTTALAAVTGLAPEAEAAVTKAPRDPWDGLKVGITTYTLRKFSLDDAIAMTKQVGIKYISLKEGHLALKSTHEQRKEARAKIDKAGLVLMGGGVIYLKNNEAEIRNAFEYARDTGMPTIVCSPEPDALDTVEKMVKEFNIRIAIHNHGPSDKKYPSPLDVMKMVKNRDERMGVCMDVGHTVRINEDPIPVMQECAKRLYEFHMKDVTAPTASGKPTEVGKGVIDIVAVLKTLVQMKWPYHVALEYEINDANPMPGMIESYAYMRGVLATV